MRVRGAGVLAVCVAHGTITFCLGCSDEQGAGLENSLCSRGGGVFVILGKDSVRLREYLRAREDELNRSLDGRVVFGNGQNGPL